MAGAHLEEAVLVCALLRSCVFRHRPTAAIVIAGLILPFSAGVQTSSLIDLGADTASGAVHGFLYGDGSMTDLGTLAGSGETVGTSINTSGAVIGYATSAGTVRAPRARQRAALSRRITRRSTPGPAQSLRAAA